MNSIEEEDKLKGLIKYGKYVLIVLIIIIVFFIVRGGGTGYNKIEKSMLEAAKQYVNKKNINVNGSRYIELTNFGLIEGTELCYKSSGVIVTNENGILKYQPFLKCADYETKIVNNKGKYIKLNGDEVTILNNGEIFSDPNYTIIGELLNGYVDVRNEEVKSEPGIYTVYYDVYYPLDDGNSEETENYKLTETLSRKIIVTNNDKNLTISGLSNTEEPYLELFGERVMTISKGSKYNEPSYIAYDYKDGKISREVVVRGEVDTNKIGDYSLTYMVTNSRGKVAVATRNIHVVNRIADLDIVVDKDLKDNKAFVKVKVTGTGLSKIIGIDGKEITSSYYSFEASENKPYYITLVDVYGNKIVKEINISELDDEKPIGSCKALTTYTKTTVTVNATDNKGIAGYIYKINNNSTELLTSSAYEASEKASSVKVTIKDISGNNSDINCEIEEGSRFYVNEKGYNCLAPYTCYKQGDYGNWRYEYCSTDTCGTINRRGCSLTSVTTVVSGLGVKDKNGNLYDPYTMLTDVYNAETCKNKYCSGWGVTSKTLLYLGLKVKQDEKGRNWFYYSKNYIPTIVDHLKKGGAVVIRFGPGMYAVSKGHIMALLGVNEKDEVYLYDPNAKFGETNGKGPVNTFISTDYLTKGNATWFVLVSQ